jgi:hypothetical protein
MQGNEVKMSWTEQLNGDTIGWLLGSEEPAIRFLTRRDLLNLPADNPDLLADQELAHHSGPIASVLNAMHPDGYWVKPGPGYSGKYRSTVWAIILLAQLGASAQHEAHIAAACKYLCDQALTVHGQFSVNGAPSGTIDCLQGNLCNALLELGCEDPRLEAAFDWMARSQTGEGIAPKEDKSAPLRYYAYKCGPGFTCGVNQNQPCAWGAVKVMLAFSKLPPERRTSLIDSAIQRGIDFLLGVDPATAAYPTPNNQK